MNFFTSSRPDKKILPEPGQQGEMEGVQHVEANEEIQEGGAIVPFDDGIPERVHKEVVDPEENVSDKKILPEPGPPGQHGEMAHEEIQGVEANKEIQDVEANGEIQDVEMGGVHHVEQANEEIQEGGMLGYGEAFGDSDCTVVLHIIILLHPL